MLEASEVLLIAAAFALVWVTIFVCWVLYAAIRFFKAAHFVLKEVQDVLTKIERSIHGMKGKFEKGGEHLGRVADHIKQAVDNFSQE